MEYKIIEVPTNRMHMVYIQKCDLVVEIDNIIYSAMISYDTVIQEPIGFIQEKYLEDYFKSILANANICYLQGRYIIVWATGNHKFSLELELHNPKELQLLKQIEELEKKIKAI